MSRIGLLVGVLLLLCLPMAPMHAAQTIASGSARVTLLELFTSEGCSSCPPAEAWLNNLREERGLWREFVPVALHVSYWDRLGWRDILASKAFTDRQYAYAFEWNASSVYTPCFVRNGQEWRRETGGTISTERQAGAGELTLTWDAASRRCHIRFQPSKERADGSFSAHVALLGGGVTSNVKRGENAGRILTHEFVALHLESMTLQREPDGSASANVVLPMRSDVQPTRLALAGWVTPLGKPGALQAAGGWLENANLVLP